MVRHFIVQQGPPNNSKGCLVMLLSLVLVVEVGWSVTLYVECMESLSLVYMLLLLPCPFFQIPT